MASEYAGITMHRVGTRAVIINADIEEKIGLIGTLDKVYSNLAGKRTGDYVAGFKTDSGEKMLLTREDGFLTFPETAQICSFHEGRYIIVKERSADPFLSIYRYGQHFMQISQESKPYLFALFSLATSGLEMEQGVWIHFGFQNILSLNCGQYIFVMTEKKVVLIQNGKSVRLGTTKEEELVIVAFVLHLRSYVKTLREK